MGEWMKVNGESIYGTSASPFEMPEWGRYTKKGAKIYVHVFDWPKSRKLILPVKAASVKKASLLANGKEVTLKAKGGGIVLNLPKKAPDAIASVIVLE